MSYINEKSFHISGNNFEKASNHFKKASVPLKMSSKSLVIFIKASKSFKMPLFTGNFTFISQK
jgi:hypothetical protein